MINRFKQMGKKLLAKSKKASYFTVIIAFLITVSPLQIQAQNGSLNVSVTNATLRQFFEKIETQSNFKFSYRDATISNVGDITLDVTKQTIQQLLGQVLPGRGLQFEIEGSNILVTTKQVQPNGNVQKKRKIQGNVADKKTGEALIGANILIKGTTNGTVSDIDGNFTLDVEDGNLLVINYIGYNKQEIPVGRNTVVKVQLEDNTININEVVVVGYGTQKKLDLTSSISTISSKDMKNVIASSTESMLQGRAAGIQVATNSGAPGSSVSVKIRGVITTGDAEPLYVVDGMPMASGGGDNKFGMNSINPSDIESVQILKDATSAAIYGSRGSNGVVIITTKRGKSGKPTINFESYYGIQTLANKISALNKAQYKQYYDALGVYKPSTSNYNDFNDPALFAALPDFDWQDEIFTPAPTSNLQLSVSGGNDNSVFMISAGHSKQEGMVSGSDFSRTNFRINSDHTINKWLKFGESLNLSNSIRHRVMEGGVGFNYVSASPIITALVSDPTTTAYNENGELNYMKHSGSFNGAGIRDRANYTYNNKKISGNIYFEVSLLKELKFKSNLGLDYNLGETKEFLPSFKVVGSPLNEAQLVPSLKMQDAHATYFVVENTLTYNKTLGKHTVGLMVGQTAEMNDSYDLSGYNSTIPGNQEYLQYLSAGNPSDPNRSISGYASAWRMYSYLSRLNYSYNDKYLLTGSIRRDASSRFGPNKRAGVFPAFSLAWKIKNENFLKNIDWLYMAKIRTGWGKVGNQKNIGNYSYNTVLQPNANYPFGDPKTSWPGVTAGVTGGGYGGTNGGKPGNPVLSWEETNTTSIGADFSFFENKWSLTTDYFYKDNIGMLSQATVPDYLGIQGPDENGGKIENNGFEIELGHRKLEGDFTYDFNFNLTYIKTKVVQLDEARLSNYIETSWLSRTMEGGGIADFWGLKTDGTFKDAADVARGPVQTVGGNVGGTKPGDMKFVDMNGDGKITTDDETVIGNPMPDFTYGFTANFYYKNFDLNLFFSGVQGNEIYNNLYRVMMGRWGVNHHTDILNAWTPTNTNTNIPRFEESSLNNNLRVLSDRWIKDGSYMRFKTLSLGYTLPKKLATKLTLQNVRLYATLQNVFTLTKYKGFDPEISQSVGWGSSGLDLGVDNGNYPQPRTFLFGINVSL